MHRLLVTAWRRSPRSRLRGQGAWTWPADGARAATVRYGRRPVRGRAAPGNRRRAEPTGRRSAPRRPARSRFAGSAADPRSRVTIQTDDGYAVTLVHLGTIAVAKGAVGRRRRPGRRHGLSEDARASGTVRPSRYPRASRRGGLCRPARASSRLGPCPSPTSGPAPTPAPSPRPFRCRSLRPAPAPAPAPLRPQRLPAPVRLSRLRLRPRAPAPSPAPAPPLRLDPAPEASPALRAPAPAASSAIRHLHRSDGGRAARPRAGAGVGDRLTAAGWRGRSTASRPAAALDRTRSARRARHEPGGRQLRGSRGQPRPRASPRCGATADARVASTRRLTPSRRSVDRSDLRVPQPAATSSPRATRGACRPDGLRRSAEPRRGGRDHACARPRRARFREAACRSGRSWRRSPSAARRGGRDRGGPPVESTRGAYYLTTPIYYVNSTRTSGTRTRPSLPTSSSPPAAARCDTFFLTGVDEHASKVARVAEEQGLTPQDYADRIAALAGAPRAGRRRTTSSSGRRTRVTSCSSRISCTDPRQRPRRHLPGRLRRLVLRGLRGVQERGGPGRRELPDPPDPSRVDRGEELVLPTLAYQEQLLELYDERPDFVQPAFRYNEARSFIAGGLQDFSICRAGQPWGVPIPWDPTRSRTCGPTRSSTT